MTGVKSVLSCTGCSCDLLSFLFQLQVAFAANFDIYRFYSSLPGPTIPNRNFLHSGTSAGLAVDPSWLVLPSTTFLVVSFLLASPFLLLVQIPFF